jgi:hypothetical protein
MLGLQVKVESVTLKERQPPLIHQFQEAKLIVYLFLIVYLILYSIVHARVNSLFAVVR